MSVSFERPETRPEGGPAVRDEEEEEEEEWAAAARVAAARWGASWAECEAPNLEAEAAAEEEKPACLE